MAAPTRRTHVVRVRDTVNGTGQYMDVEVLDAIAFRTDNGEEMVLNCPTDEAEPFIVDDTGSGSAKTPSAQTATRRTHMKRVGDKKNFFNVEVLDCLAFRDKNGEEWIYNAPGEASVPVNVTDGSGGGTDATRRTHSEKVGFVGGKKNPGSDYVTVERTDMMAFRSINGSELIIKMPSGDDGSIPRAETVMRPSDYDPAKAVSKPPFNSDPHVYVKFVKGGGLLTKDEKISQGPLWWIRKIGLNSIVFVKVMYRLTNSHSNSTVIPGRPTITLTTPYDPAGTDVLDKVDKPLPGAAKVPIVNPVTDAMLDAFFQWTPAELVEKTDTAHESGDQFWYVDGSNANVSVDIHGEGFLSPFPTKDNFFKPTYFVPGQTFPIITTTEDPDPTHTISPTSFATGNTVLMDRTPAVFFFLITNGEITVANGVEVTYSSDILSAENRYPSQAAAQAAADYINAQIAIESVVGVDPRAAFVGGPIADEASQAQAVRFGTAVFELNYAQLKAAWAAKDPKAPVTFTVNVSMPGATTQSVEVDAQGYNELRDFSLDEQNNPTFTPWQDNVIQDTGAGSLSVSGSLIGTIEPDLDNPKFLKVTIAAA